MTSIKPAGAVTLLAVSCLTIMVGCVIVPGLSDIAAQLRVAYLASWLVTLPALGVILAGPLAGRAIDRFGAYPMLLIGLFCYGGLGVAGVWLPGAVPQIIDRILLGGATAVVMSAGTSLIARFYQAEARLKMIARQGMAIELGGVVFLFVGGILASASWRYPYGLYLFSWLLLVLVLICVPRPQQQMRAETIEEGVMDSDRRLRPVWLAAFCSMICFFTAVIMLPQRFALMGVNAAHIGYFLSFVSLVAVLAAALMPHVALQFGHYSTLIMAFICYLLAHLEFAAAPDVMLCLPGGILLGMGFGLSVPLVNHLTVEISQPQERGRQLARLSMAIFGGQFMAAFMTYLPGHFSMAFFAAAILAAINIIAMCKVSVRCN
ncbi:MFS transporter [Pantoea sp. Al-1710]|uniref:MFS transporter n=1 Tax=Candidatus Pantoea communis TaxID=2608354 RepID=A0ABX0RT40_9GAMM|nr:MFS transporter [Pantoea communis]NIG20254.1 MFS transporter [Pantoea communis]